MFVPLLPGVSNITPGHSVTAAPLRRPASMAAVSAESAGESMYIKVDPLSSTTAPHPSAYSTAICSDVRSEYSEMSAPSTLMLRSTRR